MDDSSFKPRVQGAVDSERLQLLSIIGHYWDELESYEYGVGTQKQKWDLWEVIGNEFNSNPHVTIKRSPLQIKTLYKNMKTKARKYKIKLETSKVSGVIVESDPVSETVLQLTKSQTKENLKTFLESLKNLRYYKLENNEPFSSTEIENFPVEESSESSDWRMAVDSDDMPDIKEEVIEAFDSPCIIREDESPISFPLDDESNHSHLSGSSEQNATSPQTKSILGSFKSTEVQQQQHKSSDLSVTRIQCDQRNDQNDPESVSNINQYSGLVSEPLVIAADPNALTAKRTLQPKQLLKPPITVVTLPEVIERDYNLPLSKTHGQYCSMKQTTDSTNSRNLPNENVCCCPEYHKRMINLSYKEHEMNISLINEKILAKREARKLHEEERKYHEQSFDLKDEQRKISQVEHKARLKLIELEYEAAKKKLKCLDRNNVWLMRNGSKEI